jgi:hypothetical protein
MQATFHAGLIAALGLAAAAPAVAATIQTPSDTVPCTLKGWSRDKDPNGLNVRAAPSASAPVVARLPWRPKAENGSLVEFEILGFKDGWALIRGASYGNYGDPPPATPLYSGQGWVHGSLVGGQVVGGQNAIGLYAEPKDAAKRLPRPSDVEEVEVKGLLDCRGAWAKIDSNIGVGWIYGLCSNQVTTCN